MKIDELYFGYTPYSKYTLLEKKHGKENAKNKPSKNNKQTQPQSQETTNDEGDKVNIKAYINLVGIDGNNSGFAEELEKLLNNIPDINDDDSGNNPVVSTINPKVAEELAKIAGTVADTANITADVFAQAGGETGMIAGMDAELEKGKNAK